MDRGGSHRSLTPATIGSLPLVFHEGVEHTLTERVAPLLG